MTHIRRSWGQITLLVLALLGVGISIYLTGVHYANVPLVCSNTGFINCDLVLKSPYSKIHGTDIPITIPGLLWCLGMAALAFAAWRIWPQRRSLRIAECIWAALGMLTVFYLVYAELVKLHTICAWCTALHVIILSMFLITVVQLQESDPEIEFEQEIEFEEEKPTKV